MLVFIFMAVSISIVVGLAVYQFICFWRMFDESWAPIWDHVNIPI